MVRYSSPPDRKAKVLQALSSITITLKYVGISNLNHLEKISPDNVPSLSLMQDIVVEDGLIHVAVGVSWIAVG